MRSDSRGKGEAVLLIHGMPTNGRLWDGVVLRSFTPISGASSSISPVWGTRHFSPYRPSYFAQVAAQIEQTPHALSKYNAGTSSVTMAVPPSLFNMPTCFPSESAASRSFRRPSSPICNPSSCSTFFVSPILGELTAPLVHAAFLAVIVMPPGYTRHAQYRPEEKFLQRILRDWRILETDAAGSLGQARGRFSGISSDLEDPPIARRWSSTVPAMCLPESFAHRAAGLIANSQLIALDSGHFIPIERAAQVSRHLLAFFRSHGAENLQDLSHLHNAKEPTRQTGFSDGRPQVSLVPQPVAQ